MRSVIDSTECVCHGMCDSKSDIGKSHTCDILAESHAFASLFFVCNGTAQGFGDQLNGFEVEHICHFPGCFCSVSFDGVCQGIHTGRSSKSLWHGRHHLRIYDCDNWHIVWVNTYKFTLLFHIGNDVVDGNFCRSTSSGRNSDDRYTWFFGRSYALKAAHIFKFRIGNDDTDGFGSIHGRATADCNEVVGTGILECLYTVLDILDGWIWFDIGINLIHKTILVQYICYLFCYTKLDQVRIRADKSFLESVCFCLGCNLLNCTCTVIRCFI